jgi:hypothetical protein
MEMQDVGSGDESFEGELEFTVKIPSEKKVPQRAARKLD